MVGGILRTAVGTLQVRQVTRWNWGWLDNHGRLLIPLGCVAGPSRSGLTTAAHTQILRLVQKIAFMLRSVDDLIVSFPLVPVVV